MLVAKVLTKKGKERYVEIMRQGLVRFDPRPGWVLVQDMHSRYKYDLEWLHPDDTVFVWVREFSFKTGIGSPSTA